MKNKVTWHDPLYVGEMLADRQDEVMRQIEEDTCPSRIRIIIPASNGRDLLDIRQAAGWAARCADADQPPIIGVAGNKKDALKLVQRMTEDCWQERQDADLRSFFGMKGQTE